MSESHGVITGGMTSGRSTTFDTPQFNASYTAQAGYRLADAMNAATFGSAQLTSDSTSTNSNGTVLFSNIAGSTENYLALYQATTYSSSVKGSGYTAARYGGVGGWQHTIVSGSLRQTRLDYFAYGTATPLTAMPHTGQVKYSLSTSGNYATNTDLWFLSGSSGNAITIDFAAGTVSGNISLSGQNFYKSQVGGIGYLPLKGTINGNSITGSILNGDLGTSGSVPTQFRILFIGPNANELVISFVANDGSQAAVGSSIGIIDPFFQ
ncbi:transferrin-binding protein-like solute binding protein [uncultured Sphingomonas sp.]|uniref:transferrin-binding protein-like solute binding protein n=1 Tax=uncultured Sphingomonas sp. TaxID=158754 RepID=UPI0035C96DA9